MKKGKTNKTKCSICGEFIDKSACDLNYMIITNIDHRPSPIKQSRSYICESCTFEINNHIDLLKLEQFTANINSGNPCN